MDIVWVEIPKGTSDEIGMGTGTVEPKSLPTMTIEQQKKLLEQKQEPLKPEPKSAPPTIEKTVTARMTYEDKNAPRVPKPPRSKTDAAIADALANIDKSLAERGEVSPGYKYGTGTSPLKVPPSDPEYIKYQAQVRAHIMNNWIVPERFATAGESAAAQLIVIINMDGEVVSMHWAKRSGSESFDASCKRAVEKSSPLPNPPQRLAWETYNEGFLIAFDARVR